MAYDAGNQSPEPVGKKESFEKLARHTFHVVNVTTLRISWNVVCKLIVIRFVPECRFHVLHGFARIQNWDRVSISSENHDERNSSKGARAASESFVTTSRSCAAEPTPAYCCSTLNETLFKRKCFQPGFLVFQTKTRRRRARPGHRRHHDSLHHQSSRNLFRSRLSEQNFFQAQTYVDSFVIGVCRCLSLCCR